MFMETGASVMSRNLEEQFELREACDQDKNKNWIIELAAELAEVAVPPPFGANRLDGLLEIPSVYSRTARRVGYGLWWPSIGRSGREWAA